MFCEIINFSPSGPPVATTPPNLLRSGGRQSSDEMSSLAASVLRDPLATPREKSLAASVLSQDETSGKRS